MPNRICLALLAVVVALVAAPPALAGAPPAAVADLSVTKDGPATATAGGDLTYTITVTNSGPDASDAATLDDPLPAGTTFVSLTQNTGPAFSCSTPVVGGTGTVNCTVASLTVGASASFTLVVATDPATPGGTFVTNIASVSAATFDPNSENDAATANTLVGSTPQRDLGITLAAPESALPDGDLSSVITVTNGGPDAGDVTVATTLPGDLTFVSLSQNDGPTFTCTAPAGGAGGTVECTLASMPAGTQATFTLVAHVPAGTPSGTMYTQQATVSTSSGDPNSENDAAAATTTVGSADVAASIAGPAGADAGDTLTYQLAITNSGPDVATTATLTDTLPANTRFVSFTQDSGPLFTLSTPAVGGTGTVTASGDLASGGSASFTLVVRVRRGAPGGTLTTTAGAGSAIADPDTTNDQQSAATQIRARPTDDGDDDDGSDSDGSAGDLTPQDPLAPVAPPSVATPRATAPPCVSARVVRFHLARRSGRAPRKVTVLVDGEVVRRYGPTATVEGSLRGKPAGAYAITTLARYADGRLVRRNGRFKTCGG